MSVIAKRTVSPSSGPWRDAFTVGELTIAVDLDIKGEKRAMGIYVTIGEDHINVFFVYYSKALSTAIDDLEKVLLNTGYGSKAQNTSTSHIYWRKVTITLLNNEKGGTTLAGIRLELEASMQVLIPKDKFSVFTMDFIWIKGTGEFSGECEFSGIGNNLPFGIPTEITEANLYVSNTNLRVSGRLEALIGKPTEMVVILDPSKIPSLQIEYAILGFLVNYIYASKEFNIILDGAISLVPFREGDPLPSLEAMIMYSLQQSQVSFSANASHIPMTALHSLFAAAHCSDITAGKGQPAQVNFEADLKIASVLLEIKFTRTDVNIWSLTAKLHKENTPAGKVSKEFILGDAVQKLLGQEGLDILPDFVIGTTFRAFESGKDKFDIVVTRLNGTKLRLVFGAELKFGMLYVQFA
ncbi:hypothetical protein ACHAP5_012236 [Fusarium lateritium]